MAKVRHLEGTQGEGRMNPLFSTQSRVERDCLEPKTQTPLTCAQYLRKSLEISIVNGNSQAS
jgi:hypothetical protein